MNKTILGWLIIGLALVLAGCGKSSESVADSQPAEFKDTYTIIATTGMVADIVANVCGDRAEVSNIIGEGVDPHLYAPTRSDVNQLVNADMVFYSGLLLEGKMADVLVKVATRGKPVYAVTELIDPQYLLADPATPEHHDPHVWMDVAGWMKAVEAVNKAMVDQHDLIGGDGYPVRTAAYLKELEALDAYAKSSIASIPETSRILVTAHDAFSYMGRAYGLEVRGIQGISTESEAGLDDVNKLVDMIVKRKIKAIFVETSVADKNVRALIEGAKSKGHDLAIGGTLFSDAMGPKGTYEGTYIGMIDHNITTITRALGGDAPAKGLNGKLTGIGHE